MRTPPRLVPGNWWLCKQCGGLKPINVHQVDYLVYVHCAECGRCLTVEDIIYFSGRLDYGFDSWRVCCRLHGLVKIPKFKPERGGEE